MTHPARAHRLPTPLARLAAGAAAALLLVAGCTGGEPGTEEERGGAEGSGAAATQEGTPALEETGTSAAVDLPGDPAEDPAYAQYYEQSIVWGPCEDLDADGAECGTITVPLAWNDPAAGDIEIAVGRLPAGGEATGSLVTNPGGPGGSGVNFLESVPTLISDDVRAAYDVIGFDPRGVNRSAGIECLSDEETDEYLAATAEPGSAEADQLSEEWAVRVAEACEAHSGDVLPYLDTYSAARDMDVLRAALGEDQLDYLGYSYGTYLGASYAELHPQRVGSFVLDGALDPSISMNEFSAGQAEGFERAIEAFLADCLEAPSGCPFKGSEEEAKQQLLSFFASVDEQPLGTGDPDRPLTGAMARSAVITLLYEDGLWEFGRQALADGMEGSGTQLQYIADLSSERRSDGSYRTNSTFAITAVNCLDHPGVADEAWVEQETERLAQEYPTVGPLLGGDGCAHWPVEPLRDPAPIAAEGAGPIVVIGTTGDPATPYRWSQSLAEQLDDAVLLTFDGNGHTAYGRSGGCIEEQVDAYLLEGTVPEDGLTC
ncbi:alpha/beta hydrolase [Brachybacterium saurashtrense]|uniref:Alpha/beta hydrolase n=1 Tax=Brachybacterium saurashtrense TaxID=556288 RepID=A0A345YPR7_9MICO|nr:alpha/beta hydrolase [Brachybacterium saurashtrense]AXK45919.1 alpha/beta hydrolase [Brachybacterium saurashtrense]RRR23657.1 alpha/beta hydrolase [Brachybacterium saurashtrense]